MFSLISLLLVGQASALPNISSVIDGLGDPTLEKADPPPAGGVDQMQVTLPVLSTRSVLGGELSYRIDMQENLADLSATHDTCNNTWVQTGQDLKRHFTYTMQKDGNDPTDCGLGPAFENTTTNQLSRKGFVGVFVQLTGQENVTVELWTFDLTLNWPKDVKLVSETILKFWAPEVQDAVILQGGAFKSTLSYWQTNAFVSPKFFMEFLDGNTAFIQHQLSDPDTGLTLTITRIWISTDVNASNANAQQGVDFSFQEIILADPKGGPGKGVAHCSVTLVSSGCTDCYLHMTSVVTIPASRRLNSQAVKKSDEVHSVLPISVVEAQTANSATSLLLMPVTMITFAMLTFL